MTIASTRTVERALALLAEVCARPAMSLADCARAVELPPSTALRHLRTLQTNGFVARRSTGLFEAGPRMIQLGAAALGRQSLVRLAQPALARIVAATGESAYISITGPSDTAIYVGMVEGTHSIRHTSWVGRAVPLAGIAVGDVLRGRVPVAGYVAERDKTEPDVTAIAAPIGTAGGTIAGALSLVGPTYRIDDAALHAFGAIVAREAAALGGAFGLPDLRDDDGTVHRKVASA
jgi:IclR family transcriptional regulator, acetate operon repressor